MATNAIIPTSDLSSQEGAPGISSSKDFEEEKFMKDLIHLRDSQDAIIGLSGWCIRNRKNNAYKIARCWLKCIKKGMSNFTSSLEPVLFYGVLDNKFFAFNFYNTSIYLF